jgi:polyisoprenoid-binding protein YceI
MDGNPPLKQGGIMSSAAGVSGSDASALADWTAGCVLTGDLTIRAVTRQVEFEVEFLGVDATGLQGETRVGFSARGAIMCRDFGIAFGLTADSKIVIGDKVDITLDVQAVLDK